MFPKLSNTVIEQGAMSPRKNITGLTQKPKVNISIRCETRVTNVHCPDSPICRKSQFHTCHLSTQEVTEGHKFKVCPDYTVIMTASAGNATCVHTVSLGVSLQIP